MYIAVLEVIPNFSKVMVTCKENWFEILLVGKHSFGKEWFLWDVLEYYYVLFFFVFNHIGYRLLAVCAAHRDKFSTKSASK